MKNLIVIAVFLFGMTTFSPANVAAQSCFHSEKTDCCKRGSKANTQAFSVAASEAADSMKVMGVCGMCKNRIESAAKKVKGVSSATWDGTTNMLVYTYEGTVNKADVSAALNRVGHDTELGKAPDKVYNKLHGCCKYR